MMKYSISLDPIIKRCQNYQRPKMTWISKICEKLLSKTHVKFTWCNQADLEQAFLSEIKHICSKGMMAIQQAEFIDHSTSKVQKKLNHALKVGQSNGCFPRRLIEKIMNDLSVMTHVDATSLLSLLKQTTSLYTDLERRSSWLLNPEVTKNSLERLDPYLDRYQIAHYLRYRMRTSFPYRFRSSIRMITVIDAISTFFYATKKAFEDPIYRGLNTVLHYDAFIDWGGTNSKHGHESIVSMNQMHGRYYIPNTGMKAVLLICALYPILSDTYLKTLQASEKEKKAWYYVFKDMGEAMNIQDLPNDVDAAQSWMETLINQHSHPSTHKAKMYQLMDDTYSKSSGMNPIIVSLYQLCTKLCIWQDYRQAIKLSPPKRWELTIGLCWIGFLDLLARQIPAQPFVPSIVKTPLYPTGHTLDSSKSSPKKPYAGSSERVKFLGSCPFQFVKQDQVKFPDSQHPVNDIQDALPMPLPKVTWGDVKKHNSQGGIWLVIHGVVYDLSSFADKHPAGKKILLANLNKDASQAFDQAGHSALTKVFALNFRVATLQSDAS
jgi:hypothetical protein